jgi:hypothetical protein
VHRECLEEFSGAYRDSNEVGAEITVISQLAPGQCRKAETALANASQSAFRVRFSRFRRLEIVVFWSVVCAAHLNRLIGAVL